MEEKGATPIFSSLQKLSVAPQANGVFGILNCCAFSLYNSGILSTTVSLFLTLRMSYYFEMSPF